MHMLAMSLIFFWQILNTSIILAADSSSVSYSSRRTTCVDEVLQKLNVYNFSTTNPALLKQILEEDMFLGGFSNFVGKMHPYFAEEVSLVPMLNGIREGIINRHPAVGDALCMALEKELFRDVSKMHLSIQRMLHRMFLLDHLVKSMSDVQFLLALKQYFADKKQEYGIRKGCCGEFCDIRKITGSIFKTAKSMTVGRVTMRQYIDFLQKGQLTALDLVRKNAGLKLNIFEARSEDLKAGTYDNAMVASVLSSNLVWDISIDREQGVVIQYLPPGWDSLYQTWNLAFVLRNVNDLEYILPKLLIPEVINAQPSHYLYRRGLALWATSLFQLFREAKGQKPTPTAPEVMAFAAAWGTINLQYAKDFAHKNNGIAEQDFADTYGHSIYWPMRNGVKYLVLGN